MHHDFKTRTIDYSEEHPPEWATPQEKIDFYPKSVAYLFRQELRRVEAEIAARETEDKKTKKRRKRKANDMSEEKNVKEGDFYKKLIVAGREFDIYYMDMGEIDSDSAGQCIPDFPFFDEKPEYTDDRYPFTNLLNDSCEHYKSGSNRPNNTCQDCIYFKDAVEEIGVCRCTARRLREEPTATGNPIRVAMIGNLPTAEKAIREAYGNVQFVSFERGTDFAFVPEKFDLVLVESFAGEGLGMMGLTCSYNANGESVIIPVRLLDEPLCRSVEAELVTLIKCDIAKKVNDEK